MRGGHREVAEALISCGGLLELDEADASSMLCELARDGDLEKIRLLLEGGAGINAADYDKRTCLHLACSVGNLSVVWLLTLTLILSLTLTLTLTLTSTLTLTLTPTLTPTLTLTRCSCSARTPPSTSTAPTGGATRRSATLWGKNTTR